MLAAGELGRVVVVWKIAVADDVRGELDELGPNRARHDGQQDCNDQPHETDLVCVRSRRNGKRRSTERRRNRPSAYSGAMDHVFQVLVFAMIPALAVVVGAAVASIRTPRARVQAMIQHFAAGVVFAAVAGEILPDLHDAHAPIATVIGFAIGVGIMLGIKELVEPEGAAEGRPSSAKAMLLVVLVDILIDGLLVGVGFAAGREKGILIMVALTLEVLFLGLSTVGQLLASGASRGRAMAWALLTSAVLLAGAAIGAMIASVLHGQVFVGVLAFGAAALLYLVTEELLVEAHETPETPLTTAVFFLGFLVLFLIESAV